MEKRPTKSPIKNLPVRMPGQSLREQLDALFDDKVLPLFMVVTFLIILAGIEWLAVWRRIPRQPWFYTITALVAFLIACIKIRPVVGVARNLRLGRQGEEAVGQFLDEKLRPLDCQILHDIPGDSFNLDHVVVGPTGVFSVETKTHSKPAKGPCTVTFDGEKVTVNGFAPDRDPIVQAKAQARWLSETLEQTTGRRFFVQPIVVYPGWFVEPNPHNTDVWVLNANPVPTFIMNVRRTLSPEDIALITFHLKRYVISQDKAK
jgi:hypothetical protein